MIIIKSARNLLAIIIAITIIITAIIVVVIIPKNIRVATELLGDNGYQLAVEQNLMKEVNIPFSEIDATVNHIGYDGIRLYIGIKSNIFLESDFVGFGLVVNGNKLIPISKSYNMSPNEYLAICDYFVYNKDQDLQIFFTEADTTYKSDLFRIDTVETTNRTINEYFEEIYLKEVKTAKTSTLFEFELFALIDVNNFQIENEEGHVFTDVHVYNDNKYFKVIFPTIINISQKFTIHAKDKDGFILMTIPINTMLNET